MSTATIAAQGAVAATAEARPAAAVRLLFVDNLRILLTILVLLHHTMIVYAAAGDWMYMEGRQDMLTAVMGAWFCAVNQAYFMGLFFLISAYFVVQAYERKGAARFLKDRLIRLGIPLLIYSWVIDPLLVYGYLTWSGQLNMSLSSFLGVYFRNGRIAGAGPLWFVQLLLIFSAAYTLWRVLTAGRPRRPQAQPAEFPRERWIVLFGLLLALATYVVRIAFPIGSNWRPLNLQLPFTLQYLALFALGLAAYRGNWLLGLPDRVGRRWLSVAVLIVLSFVPMGIVGGMTESTEPFMGRGTWQSMVLCIWESYLCVAACIGLVYLFRRYRNRQGAVAASMSRSAYAAYIVQAPVIVGLAVAMQGVDAYPLLKFVVVGLLVVAACFGLGALLRRLPLAERVLG